MKIALDVMGGDNAPDINMDGAKRALQDFPLIEKIYLVGREEVVRSSCDRWGLSGPRVEIVPAAGRKAPSGHRSCAPPLPSPQDRFFQ